MYMYNSKTMQVTVEVSRKVYKFKCLLFKFEFRITDKKEYSNG